MSPSLSEACVDEWRKAGGKLSYARKKRMRGCFSAGESVTGQRSNQLNYVPTLFSYLYRKPVSLLAFLMFNRFACVAHFNPIEPNPEVNGHHGHQAKPPSKNCSAGKPNPEQLSLPRD